MDSPRASGLIDTQEGVPVFLEEPRDHYYIVKNRPVTVVCRASPAIHIYFKCAGQWMRPELHVNSETVERGGRVVMQTSIDVGREEVEEYFGLDRYWCECHAFNSVADASQPIITRSSRGIVEIACKYSLSVYKYFLFYV